MKIFRSRFLMVAGLASTAGLMLNVNCGGSSGGGTGGTPGTGGAITGTGGTHTGGTTGTGGTAGSSATGGTAGSSATGGTAGSSANGGAGGHATGGAGGNSNTDGGVQQYAALSYTFDHDLQGFALDAYTGAGNLVNVDGGTHPTLTWDSAVGKTTAGSAKVQATFTGYNQTVLSTLNIRPLIDAAGKTITAWVLVDAVDGGTPFSGYSQIQVNTTTGYHGATGPAVGLTPGTWQMVTFPLSTPAAPFDASQIIQISVKIATGGQPDGGTFGAPEHVTFHFDTITDGSNNPAPPALNATFDANTQGFGAAIFTAPDGGATPTVTFDSTVGDPTPGSLAVTLPFTTYGQAYAIQSGVQPTTNLSGKTIHAWVMLDKVDGGSPTFTAGYVQIFAESGSGYVFANGSGAGLTAGVWTDVTMNVTTPASKGTGYDPTQIVQVGVQIGTGGMPDGGVFGAHEALKLHIDSIVAQ